MSGKAEPVVLFLNHWARGMGGAEYSLLDILESARAVFSCHLCTTEDGPLVKRAESFGIHCHIVPCAAALAVVRRGTLLRSCALLWRDAAVLAAYLFRLRRLVRALNPSLIHANVPKSHVALFFLGIAGFRGHCCYHIREIFGRASFPTALYALLFRSRNGSAIAISYAVKNHLPAGMQRAAAVIHNGVAVSSAPKDGFRGGPLRMLYLGRIVPWKGCHLLIDILYLVRKKFGPNSAGLSLVGDTLYWDRNYRDELRARISGYTMDACCTILPHTEHPGELYRAHDIFCTASIREPFGRSVAEAQGCGLPVVAFNSGGIPEIVAHGTTGYLVPGSDLEGFCDAIGSFIAHPERIREMGSSGRDRVMTSFNRDRQVPLIVSRMRRLIDSQENEPY
jgi:glycosyltransferase involved in cell wall biosynthesis